MSPMQPPSVCPKPDNQQFAIVQPLPQSIPISWLDYWFKKKIKNKATGLWV